MTAWGSAILTSVRGAGSRVAWFGVAVLLAAVAVALPLRGERGPSFADRIRTLSEPNGYFDTDNLVSNESSYLHVIPSLNQSGLTGGVYIGVGPDQNYSYIARLRPAVAYLLDVRRDNLLLHLLFKAMFEMAPTRIEYLSLLTGRAPPPAKLKDRELALPEVIQWVDTAARTDRAALRSAVEARLRGYGVPLSHDDLETIDRFHGAFIDEGLDLQFRSHRRGPNGYYPTLRALLMATDRTGQRWSYMDTEDAYAVIRSLHGQHAIVPVVGDLSGPRALRAIGAEMKVTGHSLSVIYVSNAEDYLFRDGRFEAFVSNLNAVPRTPGALLIRSIFRGGPSVSEVQRIDDMASGVASGRYSNYGDLIYSRRGWRAR